MPCFGLSMLELLFHRLVLSFFISAIFPSLDMRIRSCKGTAPSIGPQERRLSPRSRLSLLCCGLFSYVKCELNAGELCSSVLRLLLVSCSLKNWSNSVASPLAAFDDVFAEEVVTGVAGGVSNASSPRTIAGDRDFADYHVRQRTRRFLFGLKRLLVALQGNAVNHVGCLAPMFALSLEFCRSTFLLIGLVLRHLSCALLLRDEMFECCAFLSIFCHSAPSSSTSFFFFSATRLYLSVR